MFMLGTITTAKNITFSGGACNYGKVVFTAIEREELQLIAGTHVHARLQTVGGKDPSHISVETQNFSFFPRGKPAHFQEKKAESIFVVQTTKEREERNKEAKSTPIFHSVLSARVQLGNDKKAEKGAAISSF